ncbi:hypothetical protein RN001_014773 [Aquatica leii]|uniref:Uncharacterized protein n=1 Tax=Aquatica leii TaxID=1421715 RepID=A0AAN7SBV6_9COLE|nr:hypothetical protein RN001_014773 [Aquatica leii]
MYIQVVVVFFLAFFSDGFGVHGDAGVYEVTTQKLRPGGLVRRTKRPVVPATTVASLVVPVVKDFTLSPLRPGGLVRRTKLPKLSIGLAETITLPSITNLGVEVPVPDLNLGGLEQKPKQTVTVPSITNVGVEVPLPGLNLGGFLQKPKQPVAVPSITNVSVEVPIPGLNLGRSVQKPKQQKDVLSESFVANAGSGVGAVIEDNLAKLRPGGLVRRTKPPVVAAAVVEATTQYNVEDATTAKLRPGGLVRRTKSPKTSATELPLQYGANTEMVPEILTTAKLRPGGLVRRTKPPLLAATTKPSIQDDVTKTPEGNVIDTTAKLRPGGLVRRTKPPTNAVATQSSIIAVTPNDQIVFVDANTDESILLKTSKINNFGLETRHKDLKTTTSKADIIFETDDVQYVSGSKFETIYPEGKKLTTTLEESISNDSDLDSHREEELGTGEGLTTLEPGPMDLGKERHVGGVKFETIYVDGKKLTKVTLPFSLTEREGEETALVFDLQVPIGNSTISSQDVKDKTVHYELISREEGKEVVKFIVPGTDERPEIVMVVHRYEEDDSYFTCLKKNAKAFVSAIGVPAVIAVVTIASVEFLVLLVSVIVLLHRKTGKMNFIVVTKLCQLVSVIFNQ